VCLSEKEVRRVSEAEAGTDAILQRHLDRTCPIPRLRVGLPDTSVQPISQNFPKSAPEKLLSAGAAAEKVGGIIASVPFCGDLPAAAQIWGAMGSFPRVICNKLSRCFRPRSGLYKASAICKISSLLTRGCSSVGRAPPCQGGCRRFESDHPLFWLRPKLADPIRVGSFLVATLRIRSEEPVRTTAKKVLKGPKCRVCCTSGLSLTDYQ
jgi:hypothetical protein